MAQAQSVTIVREVDSDRYDPHRSTARAASEALFMMADTLVSLDFDMKTVKPGLAESWTASPDGRLPDRPSLQDSVEDRLISSERRRTIGEAVERLPNRQRAVFTLCHIGEQSTAEVSQALGLSEATVRVHLFRAIRKLQSLLVAEVTA